MKKNKSEPLEYVVVQNNNQHWHFFSSSMHQIRKMKFLTAVLLNIKVFWYLAP